MSQSQILATRFKQKGYTHYDITKEIERARVMDMGTIIADKIKNCNDTTNQFTMTMDYSIQYKKM